MYFKFFSIYIIYFIFLSCENIELESESILVRPLTSHSIEECSVYINPEDSTNYCDSYCILLNDGCYHEFDIYVLEKIIEDNSSFSINNPLELGLYQEWVNGRLTFISIANGLKILTEDIAYLNLLEKLYLTNNPIESIPNGIGNLKQLTTLSLTHNQINIIPDTIVSLNNLEDLFLNDNSISYIPNEIGTISNLNHLILANNLLDSIPQSLCQLSNSYIDVSNNLLCHKYNYDCIDLFINQNIENCYIDINNIQYLEYDYSVLEDLIELNNIIELEPLLLGNNQIWENGRLIFLDLSNSNISVLPESIGNLTELTTLYLYNNQIIQLPTSMENLNKMETLYINNNFISEIAFNLSSLLLLKRFDISYNIITTLPEDIGNLINLTTLNLSNNEINFIPISLCEIENTCTINLDNNNLCIDNYLYCIENYGNQECN